jgi:hypothetical protein
MKNIEELLFEQVEKPKNYLMTKAINVFDNKYRINVYCEKEEENLTKKRIHASYFARLVDDEKLEILI